MVTPATETKTAGSPAVEKRDFRQEVTDRIVSMLEEGVAPWQKPWASMNMPFNPTTEHGYRGGNALHLMATGLQRGYSDLRWMTYKQAADNGWQVRRGEKGTQIEFWDVKPTRTQASEGTREEDQDKRGSRLVHRVYTVFNASQIEGVPAYEPKRPTAFEVVQAGERILDNSGAQIQHDQADRAFYSRAQDTIHLPPKDAFKDSAGYYGTALHELAHWTGHPSRLHRATLNESYRFGDTNYAKEELRAELASVFLAAERGIPHDPAYHAAYVGSWIKTLREDKNEIFRAAHDASAATDYILALERDKSIAEVSLAKGPIVESPSSRAAVLEEQSQKLQRDRQDKVEATAQLEAEPSGDTTARASTRTVNAATDSGTYRGAIIGETDQYFLQRQSAGMVVLHPKELLDRMPQVGETFTINYSNGKGIVREAPERSKAQELGR